MDPLIGIETFSEWKTLNERQMPWPMAFRYMSPDMRFPAMWYVRPAKAQTSLHIHAVRSEP